MNGNIVSNNQFNDQAERKYRKEIFAKTVQYQEPNTQIALVMIITSFVPFFVCLGLAYLSISYSLALSLLCSLFSGAFLLRIFMIQHDCGHGSMFRSRKMNDVVGFLCSLCSMVPYYYWRRQHALHHAGSGNLDKRGHGDMDVCTVAEYLAMSKWGRLKYRIYRNPLIFLTFGPLMLFLFINRFVLDKKKTSSAERRNVHITNLLIATELCVLGYLIGFSSLVIIILPALMFAGGVGIWLFYIQHQFEHTYWKPDQQWNYVQAAMQGSSFYHLPPVLRWFTGNIGYHHIHHLVPAIPNYRLKPCHDENPELQETCEITLLSSLKTMYLCLWDEEQQRLISMRELKAKLRKNQQIKFEEPELAVSISALETCVVEES